MVDPTLTISIDRTVLSLSPLVFVGQGDGELGIEDYREPAIQPRVSYAPSSEWQHGEIAMGWSYQQSILEWSFFTDVDTESESRALIAAVRAAVTQGINFEVTVSVSDADDEVWVCNPGSVSPTESRTYLNMRTPDPVWNVSLPCYPVRSFA